MSSWICRGGRRTTRRRAALGDKSGRARKFRELLADPGRPTVLEGRHVNLGALFGARGQVAWAAHGVPAVATGCVAVGLRELNVCTSEDGRVQTSTAPQSGRTGLQPLDIRAARERARVLGARGSERQGERDKR